MKGAVWKGWRRERGQKQWVSVLVYVINCSQSLGCGISRFVQMFFLPFRLKKVAVGSVPPTYRPDSATR